VDDDRKKLQEQELELLNKWRNTGQKTYFQQLYKSYKPMLFKATEKAARGSSLPRSVFELEAAQQFHDSLQRFDASKGIQLSTFVYGSVEDKAKRLNMFQDIGRIPERGGNSLGIFHVNQLNNTREILYQKLGRDPSSFEIAQEMGVPVAKVEGLIRETKKDLSLNSTLEDAVTHDDDAKGMATLEMHYYDMSKEQQTFYDYATGEHGKQIMIKPSGKIDYNRIANAMGITLPRLHKIQAQIKQMVRATEQGY